MTSRIRPPLLCLLGLALSVSAAARAEPDGGRTADAILDDFVRAVAPGGTRRKPRSLHLSARLTVKAMGLEGSIESWMAPSGKHRQSMKLPGIGEMSSGSDGKRAWSLDPINGLRILEGAEAEQTKLDGEWLADLNLKKLYPKRRVVPAPEGAKATTPLECVELTPASAALSPAIMCFDPKTHLRVYHEARQHTPQGVVPMRRFQHEWREVDGFMLPHREDFTVGPASMTMVVERYTWNVKVSPSTFRMPKPGSPARPPSM